MQRVILTWDKSGDANSSSLSPWSQAEELMTGVVVGVLGRESKKGEFLVKDICYAGPPPVEKMEERSGQQKDQEDK